MNCIITLKLEEIVSGARPGSAQVPFAGGYVNPPEMYTIARLSGHVADEESGKPPTFDKGSIGSAKISISSSAQNSGLNTINVNECGGIVDGLQGYFSVDPAFFARLILLRSDETVRLRVSLDISSFETNSGAQLISIYSFSIGQ